MDKVRIKAPFQSLVLVSMLIWQGMTETWTCCKHSYLSQIFTPDLFCNQWNIWTMEYLFNPTLRCLVPNWHLPWRHLVSTPSILVSHGVLFFPRFCCIETSELCLRIVGAYLTYVYRSLKCKLWISDVSAFVCLILLLLASDVLLRCCECLWLSAVFLQRRLQLYHEWNNVRN